MGWLMGLEPTTTGITIQGFYQLSYSHRKNWHARQESNL